MIWHPDADPWRGPYLEGVAMVLEAVGVPTAEIGRFVCRERTLFPGEHIDLMLSGHEGLLYDLYVPDPWPQDKSQRVNECIDPLGGGRLLIPAACGNPSWVWGWPYPPTPPLFGAAKIPGYEESGAWLPGPWFSSGEWLPETLARINENSQTAVTPIGGQSIMIPEPASVFLAWSFAIFCALVIWRA